MKQVVTSKLAASKVKLRRLFPRYAAPLQPVVTYREGWKDDTQLRTLAKASEAGLPRLQQQADALAKDLAEVEANTDAKAFADERERALIERLDSVRATLEQLDAKDPETATARERYRLAAGAMTWQLAQQYPARLWEAKKGQKVMETQLAEAHRRDAALAQAQKDEPVRFDKFAERIATLVGGVVHHSRGTATVEMEPAILEAMDALRRFLFLLGAERVVPADGQCHFYGLLTESEQVGRELTKEFYVNYANMRQDAFERLSSDNPAVPRPDVLARREGVEQPLVTASPTFVATRTATVNRSR